MGARLEALFIGVLVVASNISCNFFRILCSGLEQCAILILFIIEFFSLTQLGWFKYAKNAKIKNHHRSTVAMVQNDGPDVVKLVPASTQLEKEPFQHSGVGQHHQQALGVFFGSEI